MRKWFAQVSALAVITVLPALAPPTAHLGPVAAQEAHERFAQLRRSDDLRGDPSLPGGLPGSSDRTEESGHARERGLVPRGKPPKSEDKGKAKSEEGAAKKDQR
jgi:hypothetical protein